MVEQLIRNEQVGGSIPFTSSINPVILWKHWVLLFCTRLKLVAALAIGVFQILILKWQFSIFALYYKQKYHRFSNSIFDAYNNCSDTILSSEMLVFLAFFGTQKNYAKKY